MTIAEAARRERVSEQWLGRWNADFLEAGKAGLAAGRPKPSTREQQLETRRLGANPGAWRGCGRDPGVEEVCAGQAGPSSRTSR
ncbi:helix-turn-helix domain-containing protein [Buchananella felis]|uniref:helix-turn-helix domain-containing protein n=1 Tax=Buchananella felis TaxID=3231492 RepID=UPI0035287C89